MVLFRDKNQAADTPKFKYLQNLQEDIYRQLQLLLPQDAAFHEAWGSQPGRSPLLCLYMLERHAYTLDIRLTYHFQDSPEPDNPNAHIRLYQDAKLAETISFSWRQGMQRYAGPYFPLNHLLRRQWRQNIALHKWLDYLLAQGHSTMTMNAGKIAPAERVSVESQVMASID